VQQQRSRKDVPAKVAHPQAFALCDTGLLLLPVWRVAIEQCLVCKSCVLTSLFHRRHMHRIINIGLQRVCPVELKVVALDEVMRKEP